ncbi:MAG: transglycosylase domain-containing protein, partial [Acidiferrobacter sp.]
MRTFRILLLVVLTSALIDLSVLTWRWFSMPHLARGPVPKSRFMRAYQDRKTGHRRPPLRWRPVALSAIPRTLREAVILGEDGTFYENDGFDPRAILWAARYDWHARHIVFGASTITQQTAKNLFLSPSRTFFRKGNEALLTIALTHFLTKTRILELYLDDAQFGPGLYGVAAASQYYFGKPVSTLDTREAAELAATLPDPLGS